MKPVCSPCFTCIGPVTTTRIERIQSSQEASPPTLTPHCNQGWEAARDHARSAVGTDNRLRRWLPQPDGGSASNGLLYKCILSNVDLAAPLGEDFPTLRNHACIQQT